MAEIIDDILHCQKKIHYDILSNLDEANSVKYQFLLWESLFNYKEIDTEFWSELDYVTFVLCAVIK